VLGDVLVGIGHGKEGPIIDTRGMTADEISKTLSAGDPAGYIRLQVVRDWGAPSTTCRPIALSER